MIKVMEYMALERPIVAYDLPETRVSAGESALYVPPNDPRAFASALALLAGDPERRREMGETGRRARRGGPGVALLGAPAAAGLRGPPSRAPSLGPATRCARAEAAVAPRT